MEMAIKGDVLVSKKSLKRALFLIVINDRGISLSYKNHSIRKHLYFETMKKIKAHIDIAGITIFQTLARTSSF
jgi:hypothetical protein